jgi:hypothetical protein
MEMYPSFGGEKTNQPEQNLAGKIQSAATVREVVEIINKADGIKSSADQRITALELHKLIKQLAEAHKAGITEKSPVVRQVLNQITQSEGLRDKVKELIFGLQITDLK